MSCRPPRASGGQARSGLCFERGPGILGAMLLALATRSEMPAWEVDDRHLHAALRVRGVAFEQVVWDDPSVDWRRYRGVCIRTTWDYQDKLAAFRAWLTRVAALTQLWNPPGVVLWNTHKHYLRELQRDGVPLAPTVWLDRGTRVDLPALVREHRIREGFLKPCVGATARETLRFATDPAGLASAEAHLDRLLPHEDLMLQPFLANVTTRGEWSAIFVEGRITHCVRKIPVAGDYRVQEDFGARDERYVPSPAERAAAEHAMAVVHARGGPCPGADGSPLLYGRTDFLWADDGSCVLTELELIEPSLFLRQAPSTAELFAEAWLARVRRAAGG